MYGVNVTVAPCRTVDLLARKVNLLYGRICTLAESVHVSSVAYTHIVPRASAASAQGLSDEQGVVASWAVSSGTNFQAVTANGFTPTGSGLAVYVTTSPYLGGVVDAVTTTLGRDDRDAGVRRRRPRCTRS